MFAGSDKASSKADGVLLAVHALNNSNFNEAFNTLGAVFSSRRFYPEMSHVFREQLKPAIETAFNELTVRGDQIMFGERLTEAGLPVVANDISNQDLLTILASLNPRYEWQWPVETDPKKAKPQMLAVRLDDECLEKYKHKATQPKNWTMRAEIDVLTWMPTTLGKAKISPGGVDIELNSKSEITRTSSGSLGLHNVHLYPYAAGVMLSVPKGRVKIRNGKRRLVTVNRYDQIATGLYH